jgi:iron complex outermembrane receptor protein
MKRNSDNAEGRCRCGAAGGREEPSRGDEERHRPVTESPTNHQVPKCLRGSAMNRIRIFGGQIVLALALALPASTTLAQLEEIVVTAQKREESAQDVGLTISAFDEDSLRELAAGDLDRFAGQLTNVQAYGANTFLQSVHVRGIGLNEFQGQYDSPVAQHVDEVYIAKPWMIARPLYDLQRVEVLKGPQGTLFGRNTTGGALNWYTNAPGDAFAAEVQLGGDEHERYTAQGFVNAPLSEALSSRLSFYAAFGSGGPQDNLFDGDEHGAPNLFDFRGQLAWEGERLRVRALVHGGIDKGEKVAWKGPGIFNVTFPVPGLAPGGLCPELFTGEVTRHPSACAKSAGFAAAAGFPEGEFEPEDTFTINQNRPPAVDDTFYGGYLRLDYDLGFATLTSITAYEYYERNHREDSQSDIFNSTSTHYYNEMEQVTQELRLTGEITEDWRYVVGAFYEHDDLPQVDGSDLSEQPLLNPGLIPPFADQFMSEFQLDTESIAAFFHSEYDLTDTLTINAGVRYTQDSTKVKDAYLGIGLLPQVGDEDFVTRCLVTTFPLGPVGAPACPFLGPEAPAFEDNRHDDDVSWRLGLEWTPRDNWLIYGNLTTGYRSGGYSLPFAGAATQFTPEELFAQEIGIKTQLLDDTLRINASAFNYDYDDVQVNVDDPVSPLVPITRNIGEQESRGVEGEIVWQPSERWYLKQAAGYLDAEFSKTDRTITTYVGAVPLEGKRPVNTPEWTYNGVIRYQQPLTGGWDGILLADYRWVDKRFLEATNQAFDAADDYWVLNLRGAIASQDGRWELAVYAKNVFDEEYLTYVNNIAFFKLDIFGETRTVGATLRYHYE